MQDYVFFRAVREAYSDRTRKPRRPTGPKPREFKPDTYDTVSLYRIAAPAQNGTISELLDYLRSFKRGEIKGYCLFPEGVLVNLLDNLPVITDLHEDKQDAAPEGTEHWVIQMVGKGSRSVTDEDVAKDALANLGTQYYIQIT